LVTGGERIAGGALGVLILIGAVPATAQGLVDRVAARVNGGVILLSEVRGALALGLVAGPEPQAIEGMVERRLLLQEVSRFPPAEAIDAEYGRLVAAAGAQLDRVMAATGLTPEAVRDMARDSLRIQAYLDQRFGLTVPLTEEQVAEYYQTHQDAFRRGGVLRSFEDAEADVRRLAAQERREATVTQWVRDLRQRGEVTLPRRAPYTGGQLSRPWSLADRPTPPLSARRSAVRPSRSAGAESPAS
jgi:hypothetical protein